MDSLLSVCDIKEDVSYIIDLAIKIKAGEIEDMPLEGKTLAMIFQKSSTRTRVSFDVGMYQLGGRAIFLSSNDLQMGRGEPISDTAKVLSRFVDGIMIRAIEHEDVVELAKYSNVPVISGLTNLEHPCQALADMLTIKEHFGSFKGKKICFVGDGNNVCNSLLLIAPLLGMDMSVACPEGYEPDENILKISKNFAKDNNTEITISSDINIALDNVDIVYTDVWVSMGDEAEKAKRLKDLKPYQVNKELMDIANDDAIFMHCLPAVRGQEVSADVIDGPQSVIYDEAENRLHAQKAILYHYLK
ncbi:MAG: ornithine carbamoyltransferase [Methanobrevibacter sp.]|uniref:ornithine carbamoyltransferase n=1 Tax=Methanobrevibacter sp. TaxID=66852 RepID=UPI0025F71FE6|nr:ornithine carbamoyltransferase [Methanobrevibacter sp.]MBQ2352980.1 ornithine carbamoyltransferase [Methanobrevibacter sp.]MBQ2612642.1 ornithine carbamoyltransferase [Methanobrevibacter sp.]MEE0025789.1 ornithine carbamoyltransferase [Methanobrevibacter sp.]